MTQFAPFIPWISAAFVVLCLYLGVRADRRRRLVENIPTSKTTGVFIGLVEVKGRAESEQPLTSYLAHQACVYYDWQIEEHWSRVVTETYRDNKGNTRTRQRTESGWATVAQGNELTPFFLRDDEGAIQVRPEGAKMEPQVIFSQGCSRGDPLYYAKGPRQAVAHSDHRRRFVENGVPVGTPLYVMGRARERTDVVAAEIAHQEETPLFLVSTRSEEDIRGGFRWAYRLWTLVGFLFAVGGFIGFDLVQERDLNRRLGIYALATLGFLLAYGLSWVWMVFNSLIDLRQRVRRAWSHIDVQLKRRHDLIARLVSMVKAVSAHERATQTAVGALRSEMAATPPGEPGDDFHGIQHRVVALAEAYPEFKTNEAFRRLQQSLIETEQRIALARGYFNEIASHYNTRLETIPDRFVAALASMKPRPLMSANEFERGPVEVKLDE